MLFLRQPEDHGVQVGGKLFVFFCRLGKIYATNSRAHFRHMLLVEPFHELLVIQTTPPHIGEGVVLLVCYLDPVDRFDQWSLPAC